jgi:cytochrome P450
MATEPASGAAGLLDQIDPETSRRPQVMYRALRETGPVVPLEGMGVLVTGGEEIDQVLRNPEVFSSAFSDTADLGNIRPLIPLQIDPPTHRKFRKLLDPLFAPAKMKPLDGAITDLVHQLIDGFGDAEEIDFAHQFSIPFPSQVFLTLMGLPLDELSTFLRMKDGIIRPHAVVGTSIQHPDAQAYQRETALSIYDYFEKILDERRREPQDDLLSWFLEAEIDGDRLSDTDILDICFLFLIAGLDTVTGTLDCMYGYLCEHPELRRTLREDPELVPAVVEELLRWETPVMAVARVAAEDTEIAGTPVAKGESVMVLIGSGNTDESHVEDADVVRWDRSANRHLSFGGGIHRCLGSNLARLELRIALRVWHERIADYELKPGAELVYTAGVRAVDSFPMLITHAR